MTRTRVAIVGAGVAGLSAAAVLSRHCDVTVLERANEPGGKIKQVAVGNSPVDSGPTVFTLRHLFEEIFAAAGAEFDNHVKLRKLETLARHAWPDGGKLDLFADKERSAEAIAAFASRRDADQFLNFTEKAKRIFETLSDPFLRNPAPSLLSLIARRSPAALLGIDPYTTLWRSLTRQFSDPRLRQLFARYATYCGSSPFEAPATLMLIAHVEQQGVWAVDGGMQTIAKALETVAKQNGAEFIYDTHVDAVASSAAAVSGVATALGASVEADVVILNADAAAVGAGHFGPAAAAAITLPGDATRTQSAMTWCMAAQATGFDLSVHNVFFSDDYEREFKAVFDDEAVPDAPTTYLFAPERAASRFDADDPRRESATREFEPLFCLVNAPSVGDRRDFDKQEIERCETNMLSQLRRCGLTLTLNPAQKTVTTPKDFAQRFPGSGGALFGMANHGWRASFRRPSIRTRMKGLYLAGGSAHPGSGVPMAALSGAMAARCIMKDCGLT